MANNLFDNGQYKSWLKALKQEVRRTQLKAAVSVNTALLEFYWQLGADIVEKQKDAVWGSGFLKQLSHDLLVEFPEIKGFSLRNIKYMRQWFMFWNKPESIGQQAVAQLIQIPWGHNIAIITKAKNQAEALFYVQKTIDNNWSRNVLVHQIESCLSDREGKAISNFSTTMPKPQSDLAKQLLKDPYNFDFLSLTDEYNERELEKSLVTHISEFLLELGAGFAYVGKQVPLQVGDRDFFLDLLFYHTRLHCFVVVELKTGDFEPEHVERLQKGGHGSVFNTITRNTFQTIKMAFGNEEITQQFEKCTKSFLDKILTSNIENQTLTKLRDTLLPKLLSGEIRIPDAEKMVEGIKG